MAAALLALVLFSAEPVVARPAAGDSISARTPETARADAAIVAPREFLPALDPWVRHRQEQGHRFVYIPNTGTKDDIRAAIRKAAAETGLKYVVLVGDAEPAARTDPAVAKRSVPTHHHKAVVNVKWGSEPEIASDNWYADLNDDHLPDLAVGRIAADSAEELSQIVGKILAYERSTDYGSWRQRVNFIAGVGGFSPLVDGVIEKATARMLTSGIPAGYETRMTYGSWRSPYCPDPRLFHDTTVQRHNEGCLFWVYIGHGHPTGLDQVSIPGERFHIFDIDDCHKLRVTSGSPIAILLACYTAAFDMPQDCLAEELLRAPGGPVAVLGGSRVTMPYAMGVMGTALMDEYFKNRPETLGDAIVAAKRKMMAPPDESDPLGNINRLLLDGVASVISPSRDLLEEERREHLHLFNLIGDPMLRLTYPDEVRLTVPGEVQPGERLRITGHTAVAGTGILELVCRRDTFKSQPPLRERFDPSDRALEAFHDVYQQALDRTWARWALDLPAGEFATEITIPAEAKGAGHVRLLVANGSGHALGATNLYIRPQPISTARSVEP
jgi:hypothetical protein